MSNIGSYTNKKPIACPNCKSKDIQAVGWVRGSDGDRRRVYRCRNCTQIWIDEEKKEQ